MDSSTSAQDFILRVFADRITSVSGVKELKDPKTRLQEYMQAKALELPTYEVVKTTGQVHNQTFEVSCSVSILDEPVYASGSSRTGSGRTGVGINPCMRQLQKIFAVAMLRSLADPMWASPP